MKSPFHDFPLECNHDITAITKGKLTKDVFRTAISHFDRKETPIYAVYAPDARKTDIMDWVHVDTENIPISIQKEIWKQYDQTIKISPLCPPILFYQNNQEYDGTYVFVAGAKNINDYILKELLSFEEAVKEFGKENIMVIKIG